ncbi:hypothetical protein [Streptomyces sp. HC307]|uniref:hypothetical protein n=1 Tax=Streptomyces flavusporus TaxID=3385496 RepID=UPI0039171112
MALATKKAPVSASGLSVYSQASATSGTVVLVLSYQGVSGAPNGVAAVVQGYVGVNQGGADWHLFRLARGRTTVLGPARLHDEAG